MANQRPIRAPRGKWRRGRRRPVRWIDGFTAVPAVVEAGPPATTTGYLPDALVLPQGTATSSINYRELIVGNLDTEWSDDNNVLLERLVGELSFKLNLWNNFTNANRLLENFNSFSPVVRLGVVLIEDIDEGNATPPEPPSLWQADDIADGEWLWSHQFRAWQHFEYRPDPASVTAAYVHALHDIHIDLRVRRKIGRRDRLILCHSWAFVGAPPAELDEFAISLELHPLLRVLVSTK